MRGSVCVAATFLFYLACRPRRAPQRLPTGAVYLTTLPAGADVWLDGTYVGRTPLLIDALAQGRHAVTLTKTGWAVEETDVAVPAGGTALQSIRLNAQHPGSAMRGEGAYSLRGLAKGSHVVVDGTAFTRDPLAVTPAPAGAHVVARYQPARARGAARSVSRFRNDDASRAARWCRQRRENRSRRTGR